jgi:hypothetical protein
MSIRIESRLFHALTFYYDPSASDYLKWKKLINSHGGTLVNFLDVAAIKLANSTLENPGPGFYEAIYVEDCITANKILDKSRYLIAPMLGRPMIQKDISSEQRVENITGIAPKRPRPNPEGDERYVHAPTENRLPSLFNGIKFYCYASESNGADFEALKRRVIIHGGSIVDSPEKADMRLAYRPCHESMCHEAVYVDDCIVAGELLDKSKYFMSALHGHSMIDPTKTSAERVSMNRPSVDQSERSPTGRELAVWTPTGQTNRPGIESFVRYTEVPEPPRFPRYLEPSSIVRQRQRYTEYDDFRIFDFVCAYEGKTVHVTGDYSPTSDNFWKYVAMDNHLVPGRSGQSLRERYLKWIRVGRTITQEQYLQWRSEGNSWRDVHRSVAHLNQ